MNTEELKQQISEKELRLSQLRTIDMNKMDEETRTLIKTLERDITELQERLGED